MTYRSVGKANYTVRNKEVIILKVRHFKNENWDALEIF